MIASGVSRDMAPTSWHHPDAILMMASTLLNAPEKCRRLCRNYCLIRRRCRRLRRRRRRRLGLELLNKPSLYCFSFLSSQKKIF